MNGILPLYGFLGPPIGSAFFLTFSEWFTHGDALLIAGVIGYFFGLPPALFLGNYVSACVKEKKPINLIYYYSIAVLGSLVWGSFASFGVLDFALLIMAAGAAAASILLIFVTANKPREAI